MNNTNETAGLSYFGEAILIALEKRKTERKLVDVIRRNNFIWCDG